MSERGTYHHGDLRHALVVSGLELLDSDGLAAVTLRAVARHAGVSHSAPYHHFEDKDALVAALAERAADQLVDELRTSMATAPSLPQAARSLGVAYVRYAVTHPERFRLLSRRRSTSSSSRSPEAKLAETSSVALLVLLKAIRLGQSTGAVVDDSPERLALTAWSSLHGVATLLLDGLLTDGPPTVEEAERLAESATRILLQGMLSR